MCFSAGGPRGRHPEASRSRCHSSAACLAPAAAHRARFAWNLGRCLAPGAEAWARASAVAAGRATKATPARRRAQGARESSRIAAGRQVPVPEAQRAGAAALFSWLGRARPVSRALPSSSPPATRRCTAPPRTLGTRPSSTLGPDDPRTAKRQAPNRANLEGPGRVGPQLTGGRG